MCAMYIYLFTYQVILWGNGFAIEAHLGNVENCSEMLELGNG